MATTTEVAQAGATSCCAEREVYSKSMQLLAPCRPELAIEGPHGAEGPKEIDVASLRNCNTTYMCNCY